MTKCKWCENEVPVERGDYCNRNCQGMFDTHRVREVIHNFKLDMEFEMQKIDELGYTYKDKSLKFLLNKLRKERAEVDCELTDNLPLGNIDKELLHEAIMTMLVRQRMKDLGKYAKYYE